MIILLNIYLYGMLILLLSMIVWQYLRGTHDLISFRNIAIIGFCMFQLHSAAAALRGHTRTEFLLQRPEATGSLFALMVTVFVGVFLFTYSKGYLVRRIAPRIPTAKSIPTTGMLWAIAVGLILCSVLMRYGVRIYPFHAVADMVGIAMAVAACGVVGWIWGPRLLNPVVIVGVGCIALATLVIIMAGTLGRRPLVAAGAALLWGLYFSHVRYRPPMGAAVRIAVIALVPIAFVAMYTAARDKGHRERTGLQQVQLAVERGSVREGVAELSAGQGTGGVSMWLLETHPDTFEYRYFHLLRYMVIYPVPREFWPDKPIPLSVNIADMAMMQGVRLGPTGMTIGPGIIGHAAAEGGWIALFVYAVLGGLFIRLLDELTWVNAHNPLVVVALGASFGQIVGLARGETSAFLVHFIFGVTGVYISLLLLGKALERMSGVGAMIYTPGHEAEYDDDEEYGDGREELDEYSAAYHGAGPDR